MKKNLRGELAFSLLAPALQARFSELFGVASRKSVFAWKESSLPQAQVVVLDTSSDLFSLASKPPCVIWVGLERAAPSNFSAWMGQLGRDFTVADLIDMLDRAAVFLLDWKARQPVQADSRIAFTAEYRAAGAGAGAVAAPDSVPPSRAFADSSVQREKTIASAIARVPGSRYRLASWIFLGSPFDSAGCISALALLARQPVTAQQLHTHSGLAPAELAELLKELARRKVLQVIAPAQPVPVSAAAAPRGPAPVRKGFVLRLSHWLSGAGRP